MQNHLIIDKVNEEFKTQRGKMVDILFSTNDGEIFYSMEEARKHAGKEPIFPHYKGNEGLVRKFAAKTSLERKIMMVDFLKRIRATSNASIPPSYEQYVKAFSNEQQPYEEKDSYDFAVNNIWNELTPKSWANDEIHVVYKKNNTKVEAKLLKTFENVKLFICDDILIITCHTHFELMSGDVYYIFGSLLGQRPTAEPSRV